MSGIGNGYDGPIGGSLEDTIERIDGYAIAHHVFGEDRIRHFLKGHQPSWERREQDDFTHRSDLQCTRPTPSATGGAEHEAPRRGPPHQ